MQGLGFLVFRVQDFCYEYGFCRTYRTCFVRFRLEVGFWADNVNIHTPIYSPYTLNPGKALNPKPLAPTPKALNPKPYIWDLKIPRALPEEIKYADSRDEASKKYILNGFGHARAYYLGFRVYRVQGLGFRIPRLSCRSRLYALCQERSTVKTILSQWGGQWLFAVLSALTPNTLSPKP